MNQFPDDFEFHSVSAPAGDSATEPAAGGIWLPRDEKDIIAYSDGSAVEADLADVLAQAKDRSSNSLELAAAIHNWPSQYHLSPERANLLRGLPFRDDTPQGLRVLELGAGCGAVTRFLGERFTAAREAHGPELKPRPSVVAVEGSPNRARLARARCRDLPQVEVVAANIDAIGFENKFDVVTLIGVLEYADLFWRVARDARQAGGDPFAALLQQAADFLSPEGVLILAIENKLGIKYFSGCREDHDKRFFSGIEGYPDANGARTFSRHELERLARQAGFNETQLLLPFPDYKLTSVMINADYASADASRRYNLVDWCRQSYQDYSQERIHLFNDHLALANLAASNLLAEMSNSFLLLAWKNSSSRAPVRRVEWIAQKYNLLRRPAFQTTTTLALKHDQPILTKTRAGSPCHWQPEEGESSEPRPPAGRLQHRIDSESVYYPDTTSLALSMLRALRQGTDAYPAFIARLRQWIDHLRKKVDPDSGLLRLLPPEALDCIPDNVLLDCAGELHDIDDEWQWGAPIPLDWVVFRGLFGFWQHYRPWMEAVMAPIMAAPIITTSQGSYTFPALLEACLKPLGMQIDAQRLETLAQMEQVLQAQIVIDHPMDFQYLLQASHRPIPVQRFELHEGDSVSPKLSSDMAGASAQAEQAEKWRRQTSELISNRVTFLRAQLAGRGAGGLPLAALPACSRQYDILVPIYNAYEHVARCVESLLRTTDPRHTIYLLDDASPDERILPLLRKFETDCAGLGGAPQRLPQVKVMPAEQNQGFIGNVNRGFYLSEHPVVILNSDTEVTPGWLERMDACLSSDARIGIISPLSNNATILSVPEMNAPNQLPDGMTPADVAELVARASQRTYPRLPTAVGFCMLISREVLDKVGGFDPVFGLGYGEENDMCLRAWQAGYETVCCDDAYVHHYGEASFSQVAQIDRRRQKNQALLEARWPQYLRTVRAYTLINPLRQLQESLATALARRRADQDQTGQGQAHRPHILHVIHNYGIRAGTELFTKSLAEGLADRYRSTVLYPLPQPELMTDISSEPPGGPVRVLRLNQANAAVKSFYSGFPAELTNSIIETNFTRLMAGGDFDLVHFQHLGNWATLLLPFIAKSFGKRILLSLHDYYLLCPEYHLILPEGKRCGKTGASPHDPDCLRCLAARRFSPENHAESNGGGADQQKSGETGSLESYLSERAAIVRQIVEIADVIVAPSEFVRQKYLQAFGESILPKLRVIPHGVDAPGKSPRPPRRKVLRAAFLGNMTDRKGANVFIEASRLLRGQPIRFEVFGYVQPAIQQQAAAAGILLHGGYQPQNLARLLSRVDLVVIPSVVDEVFCLTLNEAQAMGIPVVASNVGAIGDQVPQARILEGKTGFLLPPGDANALANRLLTLSRDPASLLPVIDELAKVKIKTVAENIEDYARIYAELLNVQDYSNQWLRSMLTTPTPHPAPSQVWERVNAGGRPPIPASAPSQAKTIHRAAALFKTLLESDDLETALHQHEAELDESLVRLVISNAETARADGDVELAEGLEALADYITRLMASTGLMASKRL